MKERTYAIERQFLSPFAAFSERTRGRDFLEDPCPMRTDYQRDRDRIVYCNAFKRLKNKTQVFFAPEEDHTITRLTHTMDVSQIARSIARELSLNEDLTEAIALGHDLGHTPFGHVGERVLNGLSPFGFRHNEQSVRVVESIERDGRGLNLTFEVRDGILHHTKQGTPATLEGKAVSLADRIAYINHDITDAIRAGVIREDDLPREVVSVLGDTPSKRINAAISSIVRESTGQNFVRMEERVESASETLRAFMFERVYYPANKNMQERAEEMLTSLYRLFLQKPDLMPASYLDIGAIFGTDRAVCDYLSGMTDRYVETVYRFHQSNGNLSTGVHAGTQTTE
ncbi:MAG: deoxyguanosinetriphosphate triphosphohydrolase [Clostridia bacterium]|nr:deoxyguanosinetriphosphate triphosphohydrolase [Clostridia bacterium]